MQLWNLYSLHPLPLLLPLPSLPSFRTDPAHRTSPADHLTSPPSSYHTEQNAYTKPRKIHPYKLCHKVIRAWSPKSVSDRFGEEERAKNFEIGIEAEKEELVNRRREEPGNKMKSVHAHHAARCTRYANKQARISDQYRNHAAMPCRAVRPS